MEIAILAGHQDDDPFQLARAAAAAGPVDPDALDSFVAALSGIDLSGRQNPAPLRAATLPAGLLHVRLFDAQTLAALGDVYNLRDGEPLSAGDVAEALIGHFNLRDREWTHAWPRKSEFPGVLDLVIETRAP